MRRLAAAALLCPALVGAGLVAAPAGADPVVVTAAAPGLLYGDLGAAHGSPVAAATRALHEQADRLGVDADRFRFGSVRTSLIGTHVRGQELRGGVPVVGSYALVTLDGGRVREVTAKGSALPGSPVAHPVTSRAATAAATAAVGMSAALAPPRAERVLLPVGRRLVDTWRVAVASRVPAVLATVDVSAATGAVLAVSDTSLHADPKALLFDPNPVVSTRDSSLRQPGENHLPADLDQDSDALTRARVPMTMTGLTTTGSSGVLAGPWVSVTTAPVTATQGVFDVTRGQLGFEGLMAYAHIDRYQRYLQSLGLKGVNAEPQSVYALPLAGVDNSVYNAGNDLIVYGAGGVDDAEDAEVILHEYGHAMQDDQVPGFGADGGETGAMGEGFGDFQAASYFARTSKGFGDTCFADWDSTSYDSRNPACLRRLDSTKTYPKDYVDEVHDDGEIWSSFLWRLRSHLGSSEEARTASSLRLVVSSHELLAPDADFKHAVVALKQAAKSLKHPEWASRIDAAAKASGLPTAL